MEALQKGVPKKYGYSMDLNKNLLHRFVMN